MKEIHIFTGHYGSGKTEIAINFALAKKKEFSEVSIIDIDTVNPYFRTNDLKDFLEKNGINVIAGKFASTNVDMPIVPADVLSAFDKENGCFIFDVGGDDEGAYALGRYSQHFCKSGYNMHFVVNMKRLLTSSAEELFKMSQDIERASRLKITDIFNNTNISHMTDNKTLLSAEDELKRLEDMLGIKVARHCGTKDALQNIDTDKAFLMNIYLKMPF